MADDPVAAFEAAANACHGAPLRRCCVRAGLAAHLRELAATLHNHDGLCPPACPARHLYRAADQVDYPAETAGEIGGCDYCAAAVGNRHHPACPRGTTESGVRPEGGWGAMLRHGTPDLDAPVPSRCDRCGAWGGGHTAHCPLDRP